MTAGNLARDSASTAEGIDSLAQQLAATTESIRSNPALFEGLDKERAKLVGSAEALLNLVKPVDPLTDGMVALVKFTAIRLFIGWKAFEAIPASGSISHSDLAAKVGAEVSLTTRLATVLVCTGVLARVGDDQLAHTPFSAKFSPGSPMNAIVKMSFDTFFHALLSMPAYYDEYGRKEPTGRYKTVFAFAAGDPDLTVWEHTNRDPEKKANFMASMVAMSNMMPMTGSYDFSWILDKMSGPQDRALVVDVGGGSGHALQAIVKATPGLPMSRCVVEDLKAVVEEAKANATGEVKEAQFVAMDFHSEQPVKGAVAYYIRRCLHDYGDDECVEILEQIRNAMADDSRLLIVEQVLGNLPTPFAAANDIWMSAIGGKERTLEGFTAVAGRAGLEILKVYPSPGSEVAVIECRRV